MILCTYIYNTSLALALRFDLQPVRRFDTLTLFPRTLGPSRIVMSWQWTFLRSTIILWHTSMTSSNHQIRTCLPASEMKLHLNGGHPRSSIKIKWVSIEFTCLVVPFAPLVLYPFGRLSCQGISYHNPFLWVRRSLWARRWQQSE